jgi:hypothetical protein
MSVGIDSGAGWGDRVKGGCYRFGREARHEINFKANSLNPLKRVAEMGWKFAELLEFGVKRE